MYRPASRAPSVITPSVTPRETNGTNIIECEPTRSNAARSRPISSSAASSSGSSVDASSGSPLTITWRSSAGASGPTT